MISVKDMAGLVEPAESADLIKALKDAVTVPVDFHTHCTPGYGVVANVTTATDANVTSRTWVHNLYVTVIPQTADDAAWLTGVDSENAFIVLDGVDSGLGLNTGLPVLILPMTFTFSNWPYGQNTGPDVDICIEVRQTSSR